MLVKNLNSYLFPGCRKCACSRFYFAVRNRLLRPRIPYQSPFIQTQDPGQKILDIVPECRPVEPLALQDILEWHGNGMNETRNGGPTLMLNQGIAGHLRSNGTPFRGTVERFPSVRSIMYGEQV